MKVIIYTLAIGVLTALTVSVWVFTLLELENALREPVRAPESSLGVEVWHLDGQLQETIDISELQDTRGHEIQGGLYE